MIIGPQPLGVRQNARVQKRKCQRDFWRVAHKNWQKRPAPIARKRDEVHIGPAIIAPQRIAHGQNAKNVKTRTLTNQRVRHPRIHPLLTRIVRDWYTLPVAADQQKWKSQNNLWATRPGSRVTEVTFVPPKHE